MIAIKDIVVVEPAGYWKCAKYIHIHNMIIMIQRKFQLRRLVIVIIVTPLKFRINLVYYTGPVATQRLIKHAKFAKFYCVWPLSLLFVLKPFFEQI